MNKPNQRALVVDDEKLVRSLTVRALQQAGFECEEAADGKEAMEQLNRQAFDLLVTDLRMPTRNGHRLAVQVLKREPRPFVVVLTGVAEPRIAEDLLIRGVDDIVFKPVAYDAFAAKVRTMMALRGNQGAAPTLAEQPGPTETPQPVTALELGRRMSDASQNFSVSPTALEAFHRSRSGRWNASRIAEAVQGDAALTEQILRVVNNPYYNSARRPIRTAENAVIRVGQKTVGELAFAHAALSLVTNSQVSWLDTSLCWRRCVAAGIAMDRLIAAGDHDGIESGLHATAVTHPLGRIVLSTLFPKHYESLIDRCRETGTSLREEEASFFPVPHGNVLVNLLNGWGVPVTVIRPLTQLHASYESIERIADPERTRAQLLKVAVFLGRLAASGWEPWDAVEPPPDALLRRLQVPHVGRLVEQIAEDTRLLCESRIGWASDCPPAAVQAKPRPSVVVPYSSAASDATDLLPTYLSQQGFRLRTISTAMEGRQRGVLLDCRDRASLPLPGWVRSIPSEQCLLVADRRDVKSLAPLGTVSALPMSHQRFTETITHAFQATPSPVAG